MRGGGKGGMAHGPRLGEHGEDTARVFDGDVITLLELQLILKPRCDFFIYIWGNKSTRRRRLHSRAQT